MEFTWLIYLFSLIRVVTLLLCLAPIKGHLTCIC